MEIKKGDEKRGGRFQRDLNYFCDSAFFPEIARRFTAEAVTPKYRAPSAPEYPIRLTAKRQNILRAFSTPRPRPPDLISPSFSSSPATIVFITSARLTAFRLNRRVSSSRFAASARPSLDARPQTNRVSAVLAWAYRIPFPQPCQVLLEPTLYPFSDGGRQALLLAGGFGRHAPEASVGMDRDSEKALRLRYQRREALAPAPSTKKPAPYDSNPALAGPSPQARAPPGIHARPESVAASHP